MSLMLIVGVQETLIELVIIPLHKNSPTKVMGNYKFIEISRWLLINLRCHNKSRCLLLGRKCNQQAGDGNTADNRTRAQVFGEKVAKRIGRI